MNVVTVTSRQWEVRVGTRIASRHPSEAAALEAVAAFAPGAYRITSTIRATVTAPPPVETIADRFIAWTLPEFGMDGARLNPADLRVRVYRATVDDFAQAELATNPHVFATMGRWEDTTAATGVIYWYWVTVMVAGQQAESDPVAQIPRRYS